MSMVCPLMLKLNLQALKLVQVIFFSVLSTGACWSLPHPGGITFGLRILLSAAGMALRHAFMTSPTTRAASLSATHRRAKTEPRPSGTRGKDVWVYFSTSELEKKNACVITRRRLKCVSFFPAAALTLSCLSWANVLTFDLLLPSGWHDVT